jgi:hypothetical protein
MRRRLTAGGKAHGVRHRRPLVRGRLPLGVLVGHQPGVHDQRRAAQEAQAGGQRGREPGRRGGEGCQLPKAGPGARSPLEKGQQAGRAGGQARLLAPQPPATSPPGPRPRLQRALEAAVWELLRHRDGHHHVVKGGRRLLRLLLLPTALGRRRPLLPVAAAAVAAGQRDAVCAVCSRAGAGRLHRCLGALHIHLHHHRGIHPRHLHHLLLHKHLQGGQAGARVDGGGG